MDLVALASGTGSNLRAILEAADRGRCPVRVRAVLSDREDAKALELARARGIPTGVLSPKRFGGRDPWDAALRDAMAAHVPQVVVLAGFMRILGPRSVEAFRGRIVNVHPSLLPAFPGRDGPAQAIAAGVRISGCTVHVVDEGVDTGPILAQAAVPVFEGDTAASLHARIQSAEHRLLPGVLAAVARQELLLGPPPRWARTSSAALAPFFSPSEADAASAARPAAAPADAPEPGDGETD